MLAFVQLAFALSVISGTIAAPAAEPIPAEAVQLADRSPDFELGGDHLARRQDYNQDYTTGGNVNFSPSSNGYSVSFSGASDFVVGKGWSQGTTR